MVRRLLALLALHAGRTVSRAEIINVLWDEDPPATCVNLVQGYVSRLRAELRTGSPSQAGSPAASGVLVRDRSGYRLEIDADDLDLARFDALCAAARNAAEAGDLDCAVRSYRQALDCWRGPVLADLDERVRQHPAAVAAERRRVKAVVSYADLSFSFDSYASALDPLRDVVAHEPLNEGLHSRLMLALAGTGDRVSALRVYDELRRRLADDLGVDPGTELQEIHARLLRQDDPGRRRAASPRTTADGATGMRAAAPPEPPPPEPPPANGATSPQPAPPGEPAGASAAPKGTRPWVRPPAGPASPDAPEPSGGTFTAWLVAMSIVVALASVGVFAVWPRHTRAPTATAPTSTALASTAPTSTALASTAPTCPPASITSNGSAFAPTEMWSWVDGASLGGTPTADQWASARVGGLRDKDHVAGFVLRHDADHIRTAISGTEWKIESSAGVITGPITVAPAGLLQVSLTDENLVTIRYEGTVLTRRTVRSPGDGRAIRPTVWQSTPGVTMTDIRSNAVPGCV